MLILTNVFLILHIIGFAGIIAGVMSQMPKVKEGAAKINGAIMHSSWLMLVTAIALVGMSYAIGDGPNNAKIGAKAVVLLAIIVLALINKKKSNVSAGVLGTIGGLAVLNVILAVMW